VKEASLASAGFDPAELHAAYLECRRRKRSTKNALRFEIGAAQELCDLETELNDGTYRPSRSVCFITLRPKPREIFAAHFRDRVVHHLFVRQVEPYWERVFIHDSFASRKAKGTHAAVERLARFVRSATRGGRRRAWYLQADIHNFFMSVDRGLLVQLIDQGLRKQLGVPAGRLPLFCREYPRYLRLAALARRLIHHDPTARYARSCPRAQWRQVPAEKSLFGCPPGKGLPIGNLTSQFFANVYLNQLDQFVKHRLRARHYLRYVDDFVIVHPDPAVLRGWHDEIERFLRERLLLELKPAATRVQPVSNGINFLGYVQHPGHRLVRRRVVGNFAARLAEWRAELISETPDATRASYDPQRLERLQAVVNSYLAHLARASSARLQLDLFGRHAWLGHYFDLRDGYARANWKPPRDFRHFTNQLAWFRRRWPGHLVLMQVGRFVEAYGRDAAWCRAVFGLSALKPRFGRTGRVGVPVGMANTLAERVAARGRNVLLVRQTGYPLIKLRHRLPALQIVHGSLPPFGQPVYAQGEEP
jgi:RNA-directed DNA polymerase